MQPFAQGNPGFSGWMGSLKDIWSPLCFGAKSSPHPHLPGLGRLHWKKTAWSPHHSFSTSHRTNLRRTAGFKHDNPWDRKHPSCPGRIPMVNWALPCGAWTTLQATRQSSQQPFRGPKLPLFSRRFPDWSEEGKSIPPVHTSTSDCTSHCIQEGVNYWRLHSSKCYCPKWLCPLPVLSKVIFFLGCPWTSGV